jgi:hypothetical protein
MCVLVHHPVMGAWVCTSVSTERARLPIGAFLVTDLELLGGLEVQNPWWPHADLTADEFLDVWEIRIAENSPPQPVRVSNALRSLADREKLVVVTNPSANPELLRRSGIRSCTGLAAACARFAEAGFLVRLFDVPTDPERRYGFTLPPPG